LITRWVSATVVQETHSTIRDTVGLTPFDSWLLRTSRARSIEMQKARELAFAQHSAICSDAAI